MNRYITTPIYYVNAQPHLGHAYTSVIADTYSRYRRLCGDHVRFQTGTDEHGEKIVEAAQREGVPPREYVDRISAEFRATWPLLDVRPDNFIRTTDPEHVRTVQDILQRVHDNGDIYFSEYSGLYCRGCERFLTEKELVEGNCPDHLKPPEKIAEKNYFFKMSRYRRWLIDHISDNPEFITPERYRNEVLAFLREPLEDLCISRPVSRLTWGIRLPFDENFVTYVWFDALINYLTGIGYPDGPDFARYWAGAEHVIAKDILKPHAIFWPTMLKAMGLEPYRRLHVHGYWNVEETKMSKSLGNVVRPRPLVEEFGVDTVRYFTLREMVFGLDASFSIESLVARRNADLANDLGNLFSRSLSMIAKYSTTVPAADPAGRGEGDDELIAAVERMTAEYWRAMDGFKFHLALKAVWEVIGLANRYIVANEPWVLATQPEKEARLHTVLYNLAETLRIIALLLRPIMPGTSAAMEEALGVEHRLREATLETGSRWGQLKAGATINAGGQLFPRLETARKKRPKNSGGKKKNAQAAAAGKRRRSSGKELVDIDDFLRLDLRVAEIVAAEPIEKSRRLLRLTVRAPEERTIVAGIAEHYQASELIGRQVIIVANLKPAKLMGVRSEGMLLAASQTSETGDKILVLTAPEKVVSPGSRVG